MDFIVKWRKKNEIEKWVKVDVLWANSDLEGWKMKKKWKYQKLHFLKSSLMVGSISMASEENMLIVLVYVYKLDLYSLHIKWIILRLCLNFDGYGLKPEMWSKVKVLFEFLSNCTSVSEYLGGGVIYIFTCYIFFDKYF